MHKWMIVAASPLLLGNTAGTLDVTVTGLKNTKGGLIACLWKEKAGFPYCAKSKSAVKLKSAITASSMKLSFRNVPAGTYVISIEHDEDGDGKLKTNFIGMPKEGVGISNNPGGIPGWGKSQVRVNGNGAISIAMKYL